MARVCELCAKRTRVGNAVARRGKAKYLGGVGRRTLKRSRRTFKPNVQKVRAVVGGTVRRARACTACIRAGRVTKP